MRGSPPLAELRTAVGALWVPAARSAADYPALLRDEVLNRCVQAWERRQAQLTAAVATGKNGAHAEMSPALCLQLYLELEVMEAHAHDAALSRARRCHLVTSRPKTRVVRRSEFAPDRS